MRDTLGGAAVPILGLRGDDDAAINAVPVDQPGVTLRRRPGTGIAASATAVRIAAAGRRRSS